MKERIGNILPDIESVSHISWGSILTGTMIALMVQFTLLMLGFAIGFGTIQPAVHGGALAGFGIGAAIWWIVCSIVALFVGGWVSSRLAGLQRVFDGFLHGLVTWGLVTLIIIYLLTSSIGAVIGGAFGVVKDAVGTAAQAGQIAVQTPGGLGALEQELSRALGLQGGALNKSIVNEVRNDAPKILQGNFTAADRERLVTTITSTSTMSRQEAEALAQRIVTTIQKVPAQAQQVATTATRALTAAAVASFMMLILTGAAAGFGGWAGRVSGPVHV